jgi:hypothetical protein
MGHISTLENSWGFFIFFLKINIGRRLEGRYTMLFLVFFLYSRQIDEELNATNISLVRKVKNPTRVSEFRSISLCNVLYKIISKVLAKRLKDVLPYIISYK